MDAHHPWNMIPLPDHTDLNLAEIDVFTIDGIFSTPRLDNESELGYSDHHENDLSTPVPSPVPTDTSTTKETWAETTMAPPPLNRRPKARTLRNEDWAPVKDRVLELRKDKRKRLREVKEMILTEFGFEATERQYKWKIDQWNAGKNVRRNEMKAIVRKGQIRTVAEPDKRSLTFELRGEVVPKEKIDRFMKREQVPFDAIYSPSSGAETPADGILDCWTPATRFSVGRTPTPSLSGEALATNEHSFFVHNISSSPALSSITTLATSRPFEGRSPRLLHSPLAVPSSLEPNDVRLRRQLSNLEQSFGEGSEPTLGTLLELCNFLLVHGRYSSAETTARKQLAACRSLYGDGHERTGMTLSMLGQVLMLQGHYEDALGVYQKAGVILKQTSGPKSEPYLRNRIEEGVLFRCLTRDEEALEILRRAEATAQQVFGRTHDVATYAQLRLILPLVELGQFLEVEERAKELKLFYSTVTPTSQSRRIIWDVNHSLGCVLLRTGRLKEAEEIFKSIWRDAVEISGPEHPASLSYLHNIAETLMLCGRFEEAFGKTDTCISSRISVLGLNHPDTQASMRLKDRILARQRMVSRVSHGDIVQSGDVM
ncbi:hypothetical protein CONLIGDRAFT_705860 [Coniochaeta ligniaria NRRL 30616]|uniref:Clr5 domain-containing protein n=1 Tax=Coniochaeta ligniaria NRRL 30616 TaxID=1408157 RepID=A0A1J7IJY2_9PEZI|nr:hypothetical protein CONLIGDRAFT_705860 [Coniochaeta ligniaria NRRL 30616]